MHMKTLTVWLAMLLLMISAAAFAQNVVTTAPMASTPINISPIMEWAVTFSTLLISGLASLALVWMRTHLAFMKDATMNTAISNAAGRAAGLANDFLTSEAAKHTVVNPKSTAVAIGVKYLSDAFPDYIKQTGVTPDKMANMVLGELNSLVTPPVVATVPPVVPVFPLVPSQPVPTPTFPPPSVSVIGVPMVTPTSGSFSAVSR
jgi:hypothetical protein